MHVVNADISPTPSEEEAAAIMAAVEGLWPKPVVGGLPADRDRTMSWRFSGRWWQRDRYSRSDRPWT